MVGRRKGPTVAPPKFRSRKDRRQAIRFTANARFSLTPGGRLRLPKIGDVSVRWSRALPSAPSSVTVIKDPAGRYFASFVVEPGPGTLPETEPVVGIDLGLTHFAVLSDGRKIGSPRFLRRAEKKLRRAQKVLSRKELRFEGQVALVTGAGRGIGRGHALELARRGARVVVNDADGPVAKAVVDEISAAGGPAVASHNSVTTPAGGAAIVDQALDAFGQLDIVVSNAGILRDKSFGQLTPDLVDAVLDVHLRGAFHVLIPAWRQEKIAITHATSAAVALVYARQQGSQGHRGISCFAVDLEAEGVTRSPMPGMGALPLCWGGLAFDDVFVPASLFGKVATQ
jgi:hypothetical protein